MNDQICEALHSAYDLGGFDLYRRLGKNREALIEIEYGSSKVDLRPCPFCGSAPLIHGYRNRMRQGYRIRCSDEKGACRMIPETSASRTLEQAAADWNMRPKTKEDTK